MFVNESNFKGLEKLSDADLLASTRDGDAKEKSALINMLYHFREIDRRRLYADQKCESLYKFMIKVYGYSDYEAHSRISAMKMLKELPAIEEKIKTGALNLTNLTQARTLFRQEALAGNAMPTEQKLEIMEMLENKSTREAKTIVLAISSRPEELRPDKIQPITQDKIELTFTANKELEKKLEILKGRLAHKHPGIKLGDLIELAVDEMLEATNPACAPKKSRVTRALHEKANNHCENCGSTHALEIDHIKPRVLGGTDDIENLRVLCRACNQRAAHKIFGTAKMDQYRH